MHLAKIHTNATAPCRSVALGHEADMGNTDNRSRTEAKFPFHFVHRDRTDWQPMNVADMLSISVRYEKAVVRLLQPAEHCRSFVEDVVEGVSRELMYSQTREVS